MSALPAWLQSVLLWLAMALITIDLLGCSPQPTRYVSEALPLPVRPVLPPVSAAELACLSDDAYTRLVTRQRLRREYAEELEAIIRATQEPEEKARRPPEE